MPTFRISGEKEKEVVQILWEAKHRIETHFQVYGVNFGNHDHRLSRWFALTL